MCTVSIIPHPGAGGYRLVTNRDEHRERAEALPPRWREVALRGPGSGRRVRAIWPTDAAAGGTWVAAGEHGLTLAVLNLNRGPEGSGRQARGGPGANVSRGLLIPRLIASPDAEGSIEALAKMDLTRFLPFRMVALDPGLAPAGGSGALRIVEARWDSSALDAIRHDGSPVCFVSSGLGDTLVEPRLALFEEMVVNAGATAPSQDEFHAHRWPDRPQTSVMMSRADARTVSVCRVEVEPRAGDRGRWTVRMGYVPVPESAAATFSIAAPARR